MKTIEDSKLKKTILLICFLLLPLCLFSQNKQKFYIPSANDYYEVNFSDDINDRISGYFGSYEFIYPGYNQYGEHIGDGYCVKIHFSSNNDTLSVIMVIFQRETEEGEDNYQADNIELKNNFLNFKIRGTECLDSVFTGKFVVCTFATKNRPQNIVPGLLLRRNSYNREDEYPYFFEKVVK